MTRSLLCWLASVAVVHAAANFIPSSLTPPPVAREFRGAWVATVNNIDWPSKPGLSTQQQQAELLAIIEKAHQLRLNVLIFQVRPMCDALYPSQLEPWSEFLTGKMGQPPSPPWDPLLFALTEAHKRGLELHAWFNPFRARHSTAFSTVSNDHVSRTTRLAKTFGKQLWLDPGLNEVHDYSARVILDVVKRYDIDGVHIDDYFYPYPEKDPAGKEIPFPDWASWSAYEKRGGKLSRDDWRRDNVNRFVARLYREVKAAKPWVKVGISPFGIYRPGFPAQIKGFDQYEALYADPRTWLANGWLDYLAPQLYWQIDPPAQSFPVLLKWWTEHNPKQKLIVPGMNSARVGTGTNPWAANEIARQIQLARTQSGSSGHIHWNVSALMKNRSGLADLLAQTRYTEPALPPAIPGGKKPAKPVVTQENRGTAVRLSVGNGRNNLWWIVQSRRQGRWTTQHKHSVRLIIEVAPDTDAVAVRIADRFGNLSEPAVLVRSR